MAKKTPQNPYGLTPKELKWRIIYIKTLNASEASRQVYKCKNDGVAGTIGAQLVKKLAIPIAELMDEQGLTDPYLNSVLHDGLKAKKTEIVKHEGKITEEKEYIDHVTRHKYLELSYKLKGKLINKVSAVDEDGNAVGPVVLPAAKQDSNPKPGDQIPVKQPLDEPERPKIHGDA